MDVAERRVVKRIQHIRLHLVDIADCEDLRVHAVNVGGRFSFRNVKLVAHKHISLRRIDLFAGDQAMDRLIIGQVIAVFRLTDDFLHHGGLDEGQQIEIHMAVPVTQHDLFNMLLCTLRRLSDHVDMLMTQNTAKYVDTGRAVVVAADHHELRPRHRLCQGRDKIVKELHGLCRRHRAVIDITRDDNCIRLFLPGQFHDPVKYIFLVFAQVPINESESDV